MLGRLPLDEGSAWLGPSVVVGEIDQARGLFLDEPTNHLDLPAIEQLESALETYPGTLLLVTHDRRMLDAVPTNRHINVDHGRVTEY